MTRVYPWVRADPGLAYEAVGKLNRFAHAWRELLSDVDAALGTSLTDSPGSVAPGPDQPESDEPESDEPGSYIPESGEAPRAAVAESKRRVAPYSASRVAEAIDAVREALADLAAAIDEHAGPATRTTDPARLTTLADADGRCRDRVEHAARLLPTSGLEPWLDPGVTAPGDPGSLARDPERLRVTLAAWAAADIAALLTGYPALADALCEPAMTKPPWGELAAPPAAVDEASSLRHVVAVRAAMAAADPDTVRRAGLLWPRAVAGLDGAPLSVRFEANRLLLRQSLATSVDADRRHEEAEARRRTGGRAARLCHAVRRAWSSRDALAAVWSPAWLSESLSREDARVRVRLVQSLLHQGQGDGRGGPWRPRQVLVFDPRGRGRVAELRGHLDRSTEHVAVIVPGTGTAMRGFHMPAQFAADLVAADPRGGTAALAWMGTDFPQAFANESPLARFAVAGAPRLRDVVEALDVPAGADITVIGHSYGGAMTGAAECLGLRADKVIHLASAGAGPGVRGVADYPEFDPLGRPRWVRRWSLTAPGDPITWARRVDLPGRLGRLSGRLGSLSGRLGRRTRRPGRFAARLPPAATFDLGVDPTSLTGITILDAGIWERDVGRYRAGTPLTGFVGHAGVTHPATTAFRELAEVVMGP